MAGVMMEAAIDALKTYLEANMAAKVTEINSENSDTLLDGVSDWVVGELPEECPVVDTILLHPKEQQVYHETISYITTTSHIDVIVLVGDPDAEQRFRKLARYGQAVFELTHDWEKAWGDAYAVMYADRWEYSTTVDQDPFLQGLMIPVQLIKQEQVS